MERVSVVTGVASGIGKATAELLRSRGERVIGVDLHDADVIADLSTAEGLEAMVRDVEAASGGVVDSVYSIAGVLVDSPLTVKVNFFGMVGTLVGLRPLLAKSQAPRAQGIASLASISPVDDALVNAMLAGDREAALARAEAVVGSQIPFFIYNSTKQAFARWVRRHAATPEWAGASITLNAVAPGAVLTPMIATMFDDPQIVGEQEAIPAGSAVLKDVAQPSEVAALLGWLGSTANSHLCGQIIFIDGGSEVIMRQDSTW
ncbi:MAG: SDR family oxidoreductase [Propionibacteriaceae bacterium]|nr:SDR family oxidoreductase [Propionibacteriaceae bacterium]